MCETKNKRFFDSFFCGLNHVQGVITIVLLTGLFVGCQNGELVVETISVRADSIHHIVMVEDSMVKPIVYTHIGDFDVRPAAKAKKLFISMVLPSVLITKYNLERERMKVHDLSKKRKWKKKDSTYYNELKIKYKARDIENLLKRMSTVPNSIVLAQAAVESGWGRSRFFREGNNVFGMWSYNSTDERLRASIKRESGPVHVRAYADISESIGDYFKTLATARAYRGLRTALQETSDPFVLLPHLKYYSERRLDYTDQLKRIIEQNNLTQYDRYQIDPKYLVKR